VDKAQISTISVNSGRVQSSDMSVCVLWLDVGWADCGGLYGCPFLFDCLWFWYVSVNSGGRNAVPCLHLYEITFGLRSCLVTMAR